RHDDGWRFADRLGDGEQRRHRNLPRAIWVRLPRVSSRTSKRSRDADRLALRPCDPDMMRSMVRRALRVCALVLPLSPFLSAPAPTVSTSSSDYFPAAAPARLALRPPASSS